MCVAALEMLFVLEEVWLKNKDWGHESGDEPWGPDL